MKEKAGWILAIVFGVIILFLLPFLILGRFWGQGSYYGMMGPGMMGGYGYGYMSPLGIFGMALMWLVPAGFLIVLVGGSVVLINSLTRPAKPSAPAVEVRRCANCGKTAQPDWVTCPYCGKSLQ